MAKRLKHSKEPADVFQSFIASKSADDVFAYVQRGRCHAGLTDEELLGAWKETLCAWATRPADKGLREAFGDVSAECRLRALQEPSAQGTDDQGIKNALAALSSTIGEMWEKNPGEIERTVLENIDVFINNRDASN